MEGFGNNKYAKQLELLLEQNVRDEKTITKLKLKANTLRRKKSLELMRFINKTKLIEGDRALKHIQNLIATGADVNYTTLEGLTPFMISSLNGQIVVNEFLKENGADVLKKTKEGQNALMLTLAMNHIVRDGRFRDYLDIKYMPVLRQLRDFGLANSMHCDFLGNTLDDYYMGRLEPFSKHLYNQLKGYLDSDNYNNRNSAKEL